MAFLEGTPIFTDSGWKPVEKISGRDKVLVRNFLGFAEFTQPLAIKKKNHKGPVYTVGGKNWSVSATQGHKMFIREDNFGEETYKTTPIEGAKPEKNNRIIRKFKYTPVDYSKEILYTFIDGKKKSFTVSHEDWAVILAYTLTRGAFIPVSKKRALRISLREHAKAHDISILSEIFDKYGIKWYLYEDYIRLSTRTNLSARLMTRLGGYLRKDLSLPSNFVYGASSSVVELFIDTYIKCTFTSNRKRTDQFMKTSPDVGIMNSIITLATLNGYGASKTPRKETHMNGVPLKRLSYTFLITTGHETYSITQTDESQYSGSTYEIDLLDGQVYTKEGKMPIWMNPR